MSEQLSIVERIDIETAPFAKHCRFRSGFPHHGALHRISRAVVTVRDLPTDVVDALRREGCDPWLEPEEELDLGETRPGSSFVGEQNVLPPARIALAELAARIKAGPTPMERREQERATADAEARRAEEHKRLEAEKFDEWKRLTAEREEAERLATNPHYRMRRLEERLTRLEKPSPTVPSDFLPEEPMPEYQHRLSSSLGEAE